MVKNKYTVHVIDLWFNLFPNAHELHHAKPRAVKGYSGTRVPAGPCTVHVIIYDCDNVDNGKINK